MTNTQKEQILILRLRGTWLYPHCKEDGYIGEHHKIILQEKFRGGGLKTNRVNICCTAKTLLLVLRN